MPLRYYREAERLEDLQNETQRDQLIAAQGENVGVAALIDDSSDAVVVINEMGIIQFTNRPMNRLFGYRKGELEGKVGPGLAGKACCSRMSKPFDAGRVLSPTSPDSVHIAYTASPSKS